MNNLGDKDEVQISFTDIYNRSNETITVIADVPAGEDIREVFKSLKDQLSQFTETANSYYAKKNDLEQRCTDLSI